MNGEYSVDLNQLDDIVTRLSSLAQFVEDRLDTLDRKSAAVHAGAWSGAAASAHETAHREWISAATEFVAGIAEMGSAARNAHIQYTAAKTANTLMFGRR